MFKKSLSITSAILLAMGLAACDAEQTQEGKVELPEYEVAKTQEGDVDAPKFGVDTADVDVKSEEKTVEAPTVQMEEKKVEVPDVDVKSQNDS